MFNFQGDLMPSIKSIQESFHLLYESFGEPSFVKSHEFEWWGEKNLLPNIRFFLLGYFGSDLEPEIKTELLSSKTGTGYIDFVVGKTAIEFAVRLPDETRSKLTSYTNRDERTKLIRRKTWHPWLESGVHVLFDFSKDPLTLEQLDEYRELPNFGAGNFNKDGFSVLYFYKMENGEINCIRKNISFSS